ncbi:MAG: tRNA lysidine(34) synthetase TilS [Gammaproteobacteria bacterium]|nr:MAG: tRNA lysidine(34) synthetase TilS [Gammaproteobacteria bacterium]
MGFSVEAFAAVLKSAASSGASGPFHVALSGGLDSSVALQALVESTSAREVRATYVDHGLHADAPLWREHCRELCKTLGVSFSGVEIEISRQPGDSPEAAARDARYACLARALQEGETLITGHHADDQLETVLLQLFRGSGPAGLAGMPTVAAFPPGHLLRPLLSWTRADLREWAERRRMRWLEDPSNRDAGFDRNYLRLEVIPHLRRRWPSVALSVSRSARHCGEARHLLESLADIDMGQPAAPDCLEIGLLEPLPADRIRNLLRRWLDRRGLPMPDSRRLEAILRDVLKARRDAQPEVRWPGGAIRRFAGRLYALGQDDLDLLDRPPADRCWTAGSPLDLGPGLGSLEITSESGRGLAPEWLEDGPLEVRFRSGGERFRPAGYASSKSLKQLLQEAGIPPWWRPMVPLVYHGDRLLAVADLWLAEDACSDGPGCWRIRWKNRPECRKPHCE